MKKEEANQLFIQAHHAQQNGDLITAEKLFQAGLKLDPENFNAFSSSNSINRSSNFA